MPRATPKLVPRVRPDRALILLQGWKVLEFLRQGPAQTETITRELGIPQRTVERILAAYRHPAIGLITEKRGKERFHSLPPRAARSGRTTP